MISVATPVVSSRSSVTMTVSAPEEEAFLKLFRQPEGQEPSKAYTAAQIYQHLCRQLPNVMRGISCRRSLIHLGMKPRHTQLGNFYDLVLL